MLHELVRHIREKRLTQGEVAERLGISETRLSRYVRGREQMNATLRMQCARILGRTEQQLFEQKGLSMDEGIEVLTLEKFEALTVDLLKKGEQLQSLRERYPEGSAQRARLEQMIDFWNQTRDKLNRAAQVWGANASRA